MSIAARILPEFDQEMAITRRMLERVPSDQGEWKPHEKSFSLAHLAQLVSVMPGWFGPMARGIPIDLAASPGYSNETTATLLATFDENVRTSREAIADARDEQFGETWTLTHGSHVVLSLSREGAIRMNINHLVHHRGQLSVYLRLLDVPVPSIYGPSADEKGP